MHSIVDDLQGQIANLSFKNQYLVNQQPEVKKKAQLVKDNAMKSELLTKRSNILKFLDVE